MTSGTLAHAAHKSNATAAHRPARNVSGTRDVTAQSLLTRRVTVNGLIYLIGLIVVILFILSFLGLR
jgi:hypothetical protein